MKAEGVAVKVAPLLLSGGGSIRWWRSLCSPTTGDRSVTPSGVSATIECIMGVCECVMGKGLTYLKGFEGVMFNV